MLLQWLLLLGVVDVVLAELLSPMSPTPAQREERMKQKVVAKAAEEVAAQEAEAAEQATKLAEWEERMKQKANAKAAEEAAAQKAEPGGQAAKLAEREERMNQNNSVPTAEEAAATQADASE